MTAPDIDRIKKIAELARRGVGGEAKNAQAILDRLLKEHGLSLDSLDGERKAVRSFKFETGGMEKTLLCQVISQVLNTNDYPVYGFRKNGRKIENEIGFELTDSQYIEAEMRFEMYRAALKRHLDLAYHAFVQTNDIFSQDSRKQRELSEEERAKAREVLRMAGIINPVKVHRQIEG